MSDAVIMGANWWVQGSNSLINCRKRMERVKLPDLEKAQEEFVAGGGFFRVSLPQEIQALEASFSLKGSHADIRSLFGAEPGDWTTCTYYERLRDIERGVNLGRVVTLKGLIGRVGQPQIQGKRADNTDFAFRTIVLYQDIVSGVTIHEMDFFNNRLVMNGVDYSQAHNNLIAAG